MKTLKLILVFLLISSTYSFASECDETALKQAYKDANKACKELDKSDRKSCKSGVKSTEKKAWKDCRKSKKGSKSGNKYCKKIGKLTKKKNISLDLKNKFTTKAESGKCSKQDFKDAKKELKGLKSGSKYCKKIGKLTKKKNITTDLKTKFTTKAESGKCSKQDFKDAKAEFKGSKKGSKYCIKIGKLANKKKTTSAYKVLITEKVQSGKCTKEDFKLFKCEAKGTKSWDDKRKKCVKTSKIASLENTEFIKESDPNFEKCSTSWAKLKKKGKLGKYITTRILKKLKKKGCAKDKGQ
jgi:hypothetical protein